jgi:predicted HicB family RNase H-like nuclease
MNQLEYKGYIGSAEVDITEGIVHGKLLFISDIVTYEASSISDISARFRKAVDDYLAMCKELDDIPDTPCKGSFNVRIGPELHRRCAIQANLEVISLNDWVRKACEASLGNELNQKLQNNERLISISTEISEDDAQIPQNESNGIGSTWSTSIQMQMH